MTNYSALHHAEVSKRAAEGTDAQAQSIGLEHSAKTYAELSAQYANDKINQTHISNCITYIPQDIKLELNNGTLTLKAGSKLYVPNGFEQDGTTPKFDVVTIDSDLSSTVSWNGKIMTALCLDDNSIIVRQPEYFQSGTGTQSNGTCYYHTDTNKVIDKTSGGVNRDASLPIAEITGDGTQIVSIDQVFNGFGYIGSTVFALPGVKGLIPNGRNEDGTLKSTEFTTGGVLTNTDTTVTSYNRNLAINSNVLDVSSWLNYNEKDNYYYSNSGSIYLRCICGTISRGTNGVITSFTPKTVFHALDYNDKGTIAGWGMPSSRYKDLTLLATGQSYTAPANGWFSATGTATNSANRLAFANGVVQIEAMVINGWGIRTFIPAKKGDSVVFSYYNVTVSNLYFVYAEGEV